MSLTWWAVIWLSLAGTFDDIAHSTCQTCVCGEDIYLSICLEFGFVFMFYSGRVAKEVMEQSAKIKREPPEIHR